MKKQITCLLILAITLFACRKENATSTPVTKNGSQTSALSKGPAIRDTEFEKLMESITGLPSSTQIGIIRRYADEKKFVQIKKSRLSQTQSVSEDYPGLEEFYLSSPSISLAYELDHSGGEKTFPIDWDVATNYFGWWTVKSFETLKVVGFGAHPPMITYFQHNGSTMWTSLPLPCSFSEG